MIGKEPYNRINFLFIFRITKPTNKFNKKSSDNYIKKEVKNSINNTLNRSNNFLCYF